MSVNYCIEDVIAIPLKDCAELIGVHHTTLKRWVESQSSKHPRIVNGSSRLLQFDLKDALDFRMNYLREERKKALKKAFELEKASKNKVTS